MRDDLGRNDPDEFGLPGRMFGVHSDAFYGAIGRIVCLSALLEQRLIRLLEVSYHGSGGPGRALAPSQALDQLRTIAKGDDEFEAFVDATAQAFDFRNHVVHDAWPAQAGGRVFGWRPPRKHAPRTEVSVPDGKDLTFAGPEDDLVAYVAIFVDLLDRARKHSDRLARHLATDGAG